MSMPQNVLSSTPEPGAFLYPRQGIRFNALHGRADQHMGGIAIGDPSHGIQYQLWQARCDGVSIYLSAPNTPEYTVLPSVGAEWVALAIDQNARLFLAWSTIDGNSFYYWYDSTIPGYRTTAVPGPERVDRIFACLDDPRVLELTTSDVLVAYERAGELFYRQQRDRFGVEYDLGPAPATLVQIGPNRGLRFQFAFQNTQGSFGGGRSQVPPSEYVGSP